MPTEFLNETAPFKGRFFFFSLIVKICKNCHILEKIKSVYDKRLFSDKRKKPTRAGTLCNNHKRSVKEYELTQLFFLKK